MTGEQISTEIFMGPTYYMRLKHMVKDKINYRPLGPRTALTRQPVSGRANDGGLRIGEMERDVLLSHGISDFLKESMMERSDKYKVAICNITGMVAIYNPAKNLFISPMADGPIKFTGSLDGKSMNIENVTKFGRDFSVVEVPYSLKLLIQELQTMNIQMRIITEDNIEQLENMTFSKNIDNLMFSENTTPQVIMTAIRSALNNKETMAPDPGSCEQTKDQPIEYAQTSPAYQPESISPDVDLSESPAYSAEEAKLFEPISPEIGPTDDERRAQGQVIYSPNSPEIGPTDEERRLGVSSPEEPPPPDFFKGGEKVHYRGDKRPERLWSVDKVGDSFITIVTEDGLGLAPEDKIKVVEPFDLYREGDYKFNMMGQPAALRPTDRINMNPENQMFSNSVPAGINFAPVIKINTGTDNSVDHATQNHPKISLDNEAIDITPSKNIMFKSDAQEQKVEKKEEKKGGDGDGGGGGGGILSGISNFLIKKLG